MKRFISLLALAVGPVLGFCAEPAQMSESKTIMSDVKDCLVGGPVSAMDETWAARTQLDWGKRAHHHEGLHLNTIQPLFRSDDMRNTFFIQAGVGLQGSDKKGADLGLGYRYLTVDSSNMFGINLFYNDNHFFDVKKEHRGYRMSLEWLTQYTTLTLGRHLNRHPQALGHLKTWGRFGDFDKAETALDLGFQLPYLPWTTFVLGKEWKDGKAHGNVFNKLNYSLTMNLLGCLSLETGYHHGWNKSPFARLILSFGRAAVTEHTLADKLFSDEAFTARDLRNYTLAMPYRTAVR